MEFITKLNNKLYSCKVISLEMDTYLELEQVFCGCTLKIDDPYGHDKKCPNYGKSNILDEPKSTIKITIEGENGELYEMTGELKNKCWREYKPDEYE